MCFDGVRRVDGGLARGVSPDVVGRLDALLQDEPLSSTTLITSSTQPARSGVWEIDTDNIDFPVPNTYLRCVLSMCSDDEYADILTLAVTADSDTGVPAPPPLPLDQLLPGAEAAGLAVPAPQEVPPAAEAKPSLLARLADLDEDFNDDTEDIATGKGGAGDDEAEDVGADAGQSEPEAAHKPPAGPVDTDGPGSTTDTEPDPTTAATATDVCSDGGRNPCRSCPPPRPPATSSCPPPAHCPRSPSDCPHPLPPRTSRPTAPARPHARSHRYASSRDRLP
ncbi:hypothetical protein GCM10010271_72860 [Streptomyces kurssanovii]|nr:hypothetical protein GCM10010271_72860 [Streptomyces kurssanovii]